MANRFLSNININDEYTLPSADGTADQIITTDGVGQLSFVDQSTLDSGSASRTEILVKNLEGSALSKGDPVYIIGSVGASERLEVGLADAGDVDKMPCVGLLTQDLAINGEGTAIVTGKLKNLITSPIDGATPTENDTIYVKSGGGLTLTKPTGSTNLIQNVGQVGRVSTSSDGNIVVSAILRSNDVPNLTTGKIWVGSAANTIESATVHLDETNERMGIGTTSPNAKLHVYNTGNGEIEVERASGALVNIQAQSAKGLIGTDSNHTFSLKTNSSERLTILNSGNVGIGTTSPGQKLEVEGNIRISKSNDITSGFELGRDGSTLDAFIIQRENADLFFRTNNSERMRIEAGGNVGIGTTSPGAKLHVANGTLRTWTPTSGTSAIFESTASNRNFLTLTAANEAELWFGNASTQTLGRVRYEMSTNNMEFWTNATQKMVVEGGGNVGIGTTSPSSRLHITDSTPVLKLQSSSNTSSTVSFDNSSGTRRASLSFSEPTDYLSLRNESGSGLVGFTSSQGEFTIGSFAQTGVIINNTSLTLKSNYSTALTCDFIGRVGIGTTSPGAKLDVLGFVNLGSSHTNYAGATYSVNMGFENYNNGFAAIATGQGTLADASQSFSMGYQSKATGVASLAGGNVNTSTALPSESAGEASLAFGNGVKTNTNASFSQAFGRGTTTGGGTTTANQAMAMGFGSTAYADNSFSGGNNSSAFGEASFAFGEGATASKGDGNIALGIGVTTPTSQYGAYGDGQVTVGKYNVHATGIAHNFAVGTGSSDLTRKTDFCVTSAGNVGIADITPSYKLDVTGEGRFTGDLRCLSLIQTSERDYKKDIRLVGKENSTIPIKEYKYKTGDNDKVRYGVVAEDIESTYPELVERDADGIKGVKYIDLLVRKIAELETEKRTLVNWRHYHSNTSYNTLYDTGMTTAFPYAYGSIPAPYDMYFTSVTLVNNPYSSYNKGPEGDTATFQAYVNGKLAYEVRDIRYGQNPYESITADFGQNV